MSFREKRNISLCAQHGEIIWLILQERSQHWYQRKNKGIISDWALTVAQLHGLNDRNLRFNYMRIWDIYDNISVTWDLHKLYLHNLVILANHLKDRIALWIFNYYQVLGNSLRSKMKSSCTEINPSLTRILIHHIYHNIIIITTIDYQLFKKDLKDFEGIMCVIHDR